MSRGLSATSDLRRAADSILDTRLYGELQIFAWLPKAVPQNVQIRGSEPFPRVICYSGGQPVHQGSRAGGEIQGPGPKNILENSLRGPEARLAGTEH